MHTLPAVEIWSNAFINSCLPERPPESADRPLDRPADRPSDRPLDRPAEPADRLANSADRPANSADRPAEPADLVARKIQRISSADSGPEVKRTKKMRDDLIEPTPAIFSFLADYFAKL